MSNPQALAALESIARALKNRGRRFALVGGLAVSVRAEIRFTRDVDVAVAVADDADAEALIFQLSQEHFTVHATVEHESQHRLATARLEASSGVIVDLLFASCGLEAEIAERAEPIPVASIGPIPVARAEDLLAMKVLSESEARLQDRLDALNLVAANPSLDLEAVRANLAQITERGYNRGQQLEPKLASVLATAKSV